MNTQAQVRELALQGLSLAAICAALPQMRTATLRRYLYVTQKAFTPEERAQAEQARRERDGIEPRNVYRQKFRHRRVHGAVHVRIGLKLLEIRRRAEMNLGEAASHWGFANRATLSAMEQGYHDFTITEVYRIAELLGMTTEELLQPPPGAITS